MARERRLSPRVLDLPFESISLTTSDGLALRAWYVPAQQGSALRAPAVVLHHHYGGQKATVLPWIRLFSELGLDVLALDGRGHGGSSARPRGRECFVSRAADVHAAADELRRRGSERLVFFGQSQGAAVVAYAAARRADVAGVIFDSGPSPIMELGAWGLARAMLEQGRVSWGVPERAVATLRLLVRTRPLRYTVHLVGALRRLRRRGLLWIHGGGDLVIRPAWAKLWFELFRPRGAVWRAVLVPGAEHVMTLQKDGALVEEAVRRFFAELELPGERSTVTRGAT